MSHSNGRIYKETVGGVKYGISIADIQATIGSSKNDIKALCQDSGINPDSLYKPYEYANPFIPGFANGGPDGMFGYTIPNTTGNLMDIYNTMWAFNPPTTWGRLDDFENYDHNPRYANNQWGLTLIETSSTLRCSLTWSGPERFVCPYRMPLFADCYMAVAIFAGYNAGGTAGWEFRYADCCQDKIGTVGGALIEIAKTDVDLTPVAQGTPVVLVPFIAQFLFRKTTNIADLNMRKWNINYKYAQFRFVEGTEPEVGPFKINLTRTATRPATFNIRISGTVVNNTNEAQTCVFYPLYRFYDGLDGTGNVLYDAMTYQAGTPQFNDTLAANETRTWEMFLTNNTGSSLEAVKSVMVQMHSPISSLADTTVIAINIS